MLSPTESKMRVISTPHFEQNVPKDGDYHIFTDSLTSLTMMLRLFRFKIRDALSVPS